MENTKDSETQKFNKTLEEYREYMRKKLIEVKPGPKSYGRIQIVYKCLIIKYL
ncbi:MAG: hypothetical protein QW607_05060 [Desulfurococcaceae archaeon]